MDEKPKNELLERVRERIRARGVDVRRRTKGGEEFWELGPEGDRFRVVAGRPDRVMDGRDWGDGGPTIRVADFVPSRTAKHWVAEGQAFADACGNANIEARGVLIQVVGFEPSGDTKSVPVAEAPREWRGAGLKVAFHLLVNPELARASIRDLAKKVGVSNGTVVGVFDDLEAEGHLGRTASGKRRLLVDAKLEARWRYEYTRRLRPKLLLGRYACADPDWYLEFKPVDHSAVWGAESAAEALGLNLRPGVRTLYAKGALGGIAKTLRLKADSEGPVEIRDWFWDPDLPHGPEAVPPHLLTIADLEATGDPRCIDAAEELLGRRRQNP